MRSAMGVCCAPCNRLTPSIVTVEVPAPATRAPMLTRQAARSTISGSLAAFSMRVVPSARQAAIMRFSVAPTLGISR